MQFEGNFDQIAIQSVYNTIQSIQSIHHGIYHSTYSTHMPKSVQYMLHLRHVTPDKNLSVAMVDIGYHKKPITALLASSS